MKKSNCEIILQLYIQNLERNDLMNSRMKRFAEEISRKPATIKKLEPDRIKGTSKIRTYTRGGFLYSKESSLDKLLKRAKLCRDASEKK